MSWPSFRAPPAADVGMSRPLESLPFDDWVAHVFDHAVADRAWYFDLDTPVWAGPAPLTLAHLTRLFGDPGRCLARYDDRQLNEGFWYLVSNSASDHMFALTDASAPLANRVRCLESFTSLFEKLFAVRCSPHLSHIDQPGAGPLNGVCYMWWDLLPLSGTPADPSRREIDAAALSVMEATLGLDSLACRESALHGLGHWYHAYPERVGDIIERALGRSTAWPPALTRYAGIAKTGCVL